MVREGCSGEETFEQGSRQSEGGNHVDIWSTDIPGRGANVGTKVMTNMVGRLEEQ